MNRNNLPGDDDINALFYCIDGWCMCVGEGGECGVIARHGTRNVDVVNFSVLWNSSQRKITPRSNWRNEKSRCFRLREP